MLRGVEALEAASPAREMERSIQASEALGTPASASAGWRRDAAVAQLESDYQRSADFELPHAFWEGNVEPELDATAFLNSDRGEIGFSGFMDVEPDVELDGFGIDTESMAFMDECYWEEGCDPSTMMARS